MISVCRIWSQLRPWSPQWVVEFKWNAFSLDMFLRVLCYTSDGFLDHCWITFSTKTFRILWNLINTRFCNNIHPPLFFSQTGSSECLRDTGSIRNVLFVKTKRPISINSCVPSLKDLGGGPCALVCVGWWHGYESIISSAVSGSSAFC